jgi:hypothetical protein
MNLKQIGKLTLIKIFILYIYTMSKRDFHDYENMMNFLFCNFGVNQTHCLYHFCSCSCQNGINNGSYLTHMCVIMKITF